MRSFDQLYDRRCSRGPILLKFGQLVPDKKGFILNGRIVLRCSGLVRNAALTDQQFLGDFYTFLLYLDLLLFLEFVGGL